MAREIIESVRIVIKTEDGVRAEVNSKGSAPRGMHLAFSMLPAKRREWLLKHMQAEHEKLAAKEAARATAAADSTGSAA